MFSQLSTRVVLGASWSPRPASLIQFLSRKFFPVSAVSSASSHIMKNIRAISPAKPKMREVSKDDKGTLFMCLDMRHGKAIREYTRWTRQVTPAYCIMIVTFTVQYWLKDCAVLKAVFYSHCGSILVAFLFFCHLNWRPNFYFKEHAIGSRVFAKNFCFGLCYYLDAVSHLFCCTKRRL